MEGNKKVINDLLVEVFNQILSVEQKVLKQRGITLTMNEVHVLEAISNVDETTMGKIAQKLRVTLGTLTTSVNKLVEKGYVERIYDKSDRRKVLVGILESGKEVLKIHSEFHSEMLENIALNTSVMEDELLISSLTKVKEFFTNNY